MLVTFRTPVYSDITMFGDIALALIERMGHSATVPGALAAEDVPAALDRLRTSIATERHLAGPRQEPGADDDEDRVSLAHRALPLIELLEAALRANAYVMWDR